MSIKLSGILRFFISSPNTNIVTGVALNTTVSVKLLKSALQDVAEAHPFLKMVPVIDKNNDAYLLLEPNVEIVVKEYQNVDYAEIAHQELQVVHQFQKKPLIYFVLNQRKNYTDLLLVANHAICDGISLNTLLVDIIKVLNDESLGFVPSYEPIESLVPVQKATFGKNILIKLVNTIWKKKNFVLTQSMINQAYQNYWDKRSTKLWIEDLDVSTTAMIVEHCKKQPYSVNTFLGTLFLYTYNKPNVLKKPTIKNFIITTNIRSKLLKDQKGVMGCYVNSIRIKLPTRYQQPIANYAVDLQKRVHEWFYSNAPFSLLTLLDINPSIIDVANLNKYGLRKDWSIQKLIQYFDLTKVNTAFILTNYGVMSPDLTGKYQIDEYLPVMVSSAMTIQKYISVYTYKGQLRIGICYDSNVISEVEIEQYAKYFKELLRQQILI